MRLGIMPKAQLISIHALREEGDAPLSMGPAKPMYFYPRPPRGGRPHDVSFVGQCDFISIHALREEGDHGHFSQSLLQCLFLSTPSARRATIPHF